MNIEQIQALRKRLYRVFNSVAEPFPAGVQVAELKQDAEAGEEGLALEMFCSQLYEYEIVVSAEVRQEIEQIGTMLGIEARHWQILD